MKLRHNSRKAGLGPLFLALASLCMPFDSMAKLVTLQVGQGLTATAEYLQGDREAPPILIQHGFLQTRDFFTVRRLAEALHEMGYSVLLPNLSLGINARQQSLSCEAVHTHDMDQDVREIYRWVHWLFMTTQQKVILIGHSAGSLHLVAFMHRYPAAPVKKLILVSLLAYGQGPVAKETPEDLMRASRQQRQNPWSLNEYGLAYCSRYMTTAGNYLSYVKWNESTTLNTIRRIRTKSIVILGREDQRVGELWRDQLRANGIKVIEVEGANHFFDHEFEFELFDAIGQLIE